MPIRTNQWTDPEPPQRVAAPMLFQEWKDVVFIHWPCPLEILEERVPPGLRLDTFDGAAWLSLISFRIPRMRAASLPAVPGLASGTETHLRTYVEASDGRRGIWLLSVEFEPLLGAGIARAGFWLPYWWSPHQVEVGASRVTYRARRRWPAGVTADLTVEPQASIIDTPRDHFLTARWILFLRYGPLLMASPVEHPRWPLRSARLVRMKETITRRVGVPPPEEPIAHFSPGVPARIGFPGVVSAERRT